MSSAADQAYEFIRSAIMSGDMLAGDRIKEEVVAENIGVSRTPIRQAMQKLAAQGFIQVSHYQGARVVDWSLTDLREITELRAVLEGFGAGTAAKKITRADLAELDTLASNMEAAAARATQADLERITDLNSRFHMKIIEASGNTRLGEVIGNLAHPLLMQRRFTAFSKPRLRRSMDHHREIMDALAAGDSDWATAIMRSHILASATDGQSGTAKDPD